MANPSANYHGEIPKRKTNRTLIFTNSAKRKSPVMSRPADANRESIASTNSEPQQSHAFELGRKPQSKQRYRPAPNRKETPLMKSQYSGSPNTAMDCSNLAGSNSIVGMDKDKENAGQSTFLFNFPQPRPNRNNVNTEASTRTIPKIDVPAKFPDHNTEESNTQVISESKQDNTDEESENEHVDRTSISAEQVDNSLPKIENIDLNDDSTTKMRKLSHKVEHKFLNVDMTTIYPERLDDMQPPHCIQQRLGGVWYCLICDTKSLSFRTLKTHVESEKHTHLAEKKQSQLDCYVDFWTSQSEDCKKYQIMYNTCEGKGSLQCSKCHKRIKDSKFHEHLSACKPLPKRYSDKRLDKRKKSFNKDNVNNGKDAVPKGVVQDVNAPCTSKETVVETQELQEKVGKGDADQAPESKKDTKKKTAPKRKHDIREHWTSSIKWMKIIEGVSSRYDKHYKFFRKHNAESINCLACEIEIEMDIIQILSHLLSTDHSRKCGFQKYFCDYVCLICEVECKSESDFWCHKNLDDDHQEEVKKLPQIRLESLEEYECMSCKLIIYGDSITIIKHLETEVRKRRANLAPIPVELEKTVIELFSNREDVDNIASELLNEALEVKKLDHQVTEIIDDLENSLNALFPGVKAYPFGSRITGICNKSSDLDVYVDIESNYYGDKLVHRTNVIQLMRRQLGMNKQTWDDIFTIAGARTPIIQLRHIPTTIDIDLSFQNGLSVENTKFLRFCMDLQPILRPSILLLKMWISVSKLKLQLTTYALSMMLIFLMQVEGHLIPVTHLRKLNRDAVENQGDEKMVTGWKIIDYSLTVEELKQYVEPIPYTVFDVLKKFFDYYSAFDYNKMICPLIGEPIDMDDWYEDNVHILPEEMSAYKEKIYNGLIPHIIYGYRFPITIQDPFDLSHILTKSINKHNREVWRANCKLMSEHLAKF